MLTTGAMGLWWPHDQTGVFLERTQVDMVRTAANQVKTITYGGVSVSDGQLTVKMNDHGGSDKNVVINGLEVVWVGSLAVAQQGGAVLPRDLRPASGDFSLSDGSLNPAGGDSLAQPPAAAADSGVQAGVGVDEALVSVSSSGISLNAAIVELTRDRATGDQADGEDDLLSEKNYWLLPALDDELLTELADGP